MPKPKMNLATLKNMVALKVEYKNLCDQSADLPHLMLISGQAGCGKTKALDSLKRDTKALYVRVLATDSPVQFLFRLMHACGLQPNCTLGNSVMTMQIADHMTNNAVPLIIDEGDHLFATHRLIETVRDIHDMTEMPVIIAGHTGIEKRMKNKPQLYSRVSKWLEFGALDMEDLVILTKRVCAVVLDEALLSHLLRETRGNLRLTRVALDLIEKFGVGNNQSKVTLEQWGQRQLFLTHQQVA